MTLIQLRYLLAIDRHRSFSVAARACHVTQPTLSMQILHLEQELDVILFDRRKKPIVPTQTGKAIIAQARTAAGEVERIREIVHHYKNILEGDLRIGIIPTVAPYLVPLFVGDFFIKYPKIRLSIEELVTEEIVERLRNGLLDGGIVVSPLNEASVTERPLFYENILIYVSQHHELAACSAIHPHQIKERDLWLLSKGHCFRSQMLNLCSRSSKRPPRQHIEYQSGSLETLMKLVDTHGGVTLLPELAYRSLPADKHPQVHSFDRRKPLREVSLITFRSAVKKDLLAALTDHILLTIPGEMKRKPHGEIVRWR